MKLTAKQRLFADEYIKSGNATQSAIKAGYASKSARFVGAENLTKPNIKSYIDAKMAEIESHKIADAKEVLQFYTRVLREEETEEVALPAGDNVITVEKKPSFKDRLSAAKELMKRYPLSDPMVQAQLKKLTAEADIAERKAEQLSNDVTDDLTINIVRNDRSIENEEANNN
ncbi:terminase small subunit [Limosilactobacillus vaginalis]|jgi:phage terminase small subunit|uniref:terminase small subunit n=1 Tax=Limosilactobacillus vaginalis TaxID=1633 RepID=UPI002069DAF0|nr:terminase small subunit [Limosilactobacillus vaginalis]WCT58828.1 terminase small subunit [Limosilactobacillus vaginalis]DAH72922.1 MAG TPA: Terminase small subunit [Caudoviricetes sp.]DAZ00687.1 MAG TPA: Terminase small subunit [Caudoviricetes sp.]